MTCDLKANLKHTRFKVAAPHLPDSKVKAQGKGTLLEMNKLGLHPQGLLLSCQNLAASMNSLL